MSTSGALKLIVLLLKACVIILNESCLKAENSNLYYSLKDPIVEKLHQAERASTSSHFSGGGQ